MTNYLIDFVNTATPQDIDTYLTENKCVILHSFNKLNKVYHISADIHPPITAIVESIINDDLTIIKPLTVIPIIPPTSGGDATVSLSDEKDWWKVYSINKIEMSAPTVQLPIYGSNTNVYVVDSGIMINHPEFLGKDIELLYSFTDTFADNTGHGTALSSVIIGETCGLTNASLKVVKIFDSSVPTKQSDLLHAFDAILTNLIQSSKLVSIVNLSWSIPRNQYIEDKILHLINAGAVVVAAAGNSGGAIQDVTPAAMSEVITIGSYGPDFIPSDFSNYSNPENISLTPGHVNSGELDCWAPGEKIWCANIDGTYAFVYGTSVSAAIYSASASYNYSQLVVSTVPTNNIVVDLGHDILARYPVANRDNLLDLSDPKYITSKNVICTYSKMNPNRMNEGHYPSKTVVQVGQYDMMRMCFIDKTSSFEILTNLPSYITVQGNVLFIRPIEEPIDPSGVDSIMILYRIVPNDGTDAFETYIHVVILGSSFNRDALPPDDPLLDIILKAQACDNAVPPGCGAANCGPGSACLTEGKACGCS
jgi:hypothetical protein